MSLEQSRRRVVVTGIGAICGLGHSVEEIWKNALLGKSGVSPITSVANAEKFLVPFGGEVKDFSLDESILSAPDKPRFDRFIHFSLHAANEALNQAKLCQLKESELAPEIGCVLGVGLGGFPLIEENHRLMMEKGARRVSPFFVPGVIPNMASGMVSLCYGLKGINYTVASACASGGHALMSAVDMIRSGRQKIVLSGGAEGTISGLCISGFANMKALSKGKNGPEKASRPFDRQRDGFVIGEGAAVLVLEDYEHALKRGVKILAEVLGAGGSSDAHHITSPHPDGAGAILSMKRAILDSGIELEQVGHINAHATSTPLGDEIESNAMRTLFGAHTDQILVTSTKSMTGHLLGGAAAIESIFCIQALLKGQIAPTINLEDQDEKCPIRVVANRPVAFSGDVVLNNVFGFGGTNASVIFKKYS